MSSDVLNSVLSTPSISVIDLPAELLCLIFNFLYASSRAEGEESWANAEVVSDALFPYAPASVSKVWRTILSTVPKFWTRIIIYTDAAEPSSISYLRSQLEWSRGLSLNVFVITRCASMFVNSPEAERVQTRKVMDVLAPHIQRCQTLFYDLIYTSSLPRLATDFPELAPRLTSLTLNAAVGNGLPGFLDGNDPVEFPFPVLHDLSIDGWNFIDIFKNASWWFSAFLEMTDGEAHSLSISRYHPTPDFCGDPFIITSAFPLLARFDSLSFSHLSFAQEDHVPSIGIYDHSDPPIHTSLSFSHLSAALIAQLLRLRFAEHTTIAHCSLNLISCLPEHELVLRDIPEADLTLDLQRLLLVWYGCSLRIEDCPGLGDRAVTALGGTRASWSSRWEYEENELHAPALRELYIARCENVSAGALRVMTEARLAWVADGGLGRLDSFKLTARGIGVGPVEEGDRAWFASVGSDVQ